MNNRLSLPNESLLGLLLFAFTAAIFGFVTHVLAWFADFSAGISKTSVEEKPEADPAKTQAVSRDRGEVSYETLDLSDLEIFEHRSPFQARLESPQEIAG